MKGIRAPILLAITRLKSGLAFSDCGVMPLPPLDPFKPDPTSIHVP